MVEGYTPEQVEEVRMVVRLLPVFFTTIMYWTVYAQMGTFFIMQARFCTAAVVASRSGQRLKAVAVCLSSIIHAGCGGRWESRLMQLQQI